MAEAEVAVKPGAASDSEAAAPSAAVPTTTISTISLQSGDTRLVIALLQSGEWLQLKLLEATPDLTKLGADLREAEELHAAHAEVLRQLQSKQSPVEELLRQADQVISTQRPRAEVYAAMAQSLGRAWADVNAHLDLRRQLLDLNVSYHRHASSCTEAMRVLEVACDEASGLPTDAESTKEALSALHEARRVSLESLMPALQDGRALLDKLRELVALGSLDSRPNAIRVAASYANSQVEHWMEALHDRRQQLEMAFTRRRERLEQCLALMLVARDLRALEDAVDRRRQELADVLGDSAASAEILLTEHRRLLPEAKEFQDRGVKITKATEQLVSSNHFAAEEAVAQAYKVLQQCAEYSEALDNRESLLQRAISFFRTAHNAMQKLDQLEQQLKMNELPVTSPQLAKIHAAAVQTIEDVTDGPLKEGYALLDVAGHGMPGSEGIKRAVEELENRKISLNGLCIAHKEEHLRVSLAMQTYKEKEEEIFSWIVQIAEAFLQGHQDMGSVLAMAQDFLQLHQQLLGDVQEKGNDINNLLLTLPPILEVATDEERVKIDEKVETLHNLWLKLKNVVEARIFLAQIYVKFHTVAVDLANEFDALDDDLKKSPEKISDETIRNVEQKWLYIQQLYTQLQSIGKSVKDECSKIGDPYLDTKRAALCVDTLLEHFGGRQLTLTQSWQTWQSTVTVERETQILWERSVVDSSKTYDWASKLDGHLYPVMTSDSSSSKVIVRELEDKLQTVLPELKKAQTEIELRVKTAENLALKGESQGQKEEITAKLIDLHGKLQVVATDYQILLQMLIAFFRNLAELEKTIENLESQYRHTRLPSSVSDIELLLKEHEASRQAVLELFKFTQNEMEQIVIRIKQQEPDAAAKHDIDSLTRLLEIKRIAWESAWTDRKLQIEQHRQLCQFDSDLHQINATLNDLSRQLDAIKGQYGESLVSAKATSQAFVYFEKTIELLEVRIQTFVSTAENMLSTERVSSPHVEHELKQLQTRWQQFHKQVVESRRLIDLSMQYFTLVEEAEEWFREGSKLLVTIARKSTSVKKPEEATQLLAEVDTFLKPGELRQDERIRKISTLAIQLYGEERSKQVSLVLSENKEMLDSFNVISEELNTLATNLKAAEEQREKQRKEQQAVEASLAAARAEAAAAKAAAAAAEEARKAAESAAKLLKETSVTVHKVDVEMQVTMPEAKQLERPQKSPSPPLKKAKIVTVTPKNVAPVFSVPLNDAVIQEGEKFTFCCCVTGTPMPEVIWYKDGISIQNNPDYQTTFKDGNCSLTIEETFTEDSAKFTCKATNAAGTAETSATLSVKEAEPEEQLSPPQFTQPLQNSTAREGSSHELRCHVEGVPLPTVQWFKDGTCVDASPDYVITFNNGEALLRFEEVFLEDQAEYSCRATNPLGSDSCCARLTVEPLEPTETPAFTVPLTNVMARAGQKIKLECEVTGLPSPQISWSHNNKPVKETRDLKVQYENNKATLVITEAFPKDAGIYVVTAKNIAGEASSSCNVSVKGRLPTETSDSELASDMEPTKPSIQVPLKDIIVFEGKRARLDCVIVGQPEPEVIWYHDDRPVKESTDIQLLFQGDRCSLIIQEAYLDDAGEYKVVAINSAGEANSKCSLSVKSLADTEPKIQPKAPEVMEEGSGKAPKFTKLLTDVMVSETESAVLDCSVEGDPLPEIKWFLNNSEIKPDAHRVFQHDKDGNVNLTIKSATPEDKGVYTVKATNKHGEAKCFSNLIIKSSGPAEVRSKVDKQVFPAFKELFADRTAYVGDSTKFECIVTGKPTPKVKWYFNDEPVSGKDFLVSTSGERQVLTIPCVANNHAGKVACVAENEVGKATCLALLTVQEAPTLPSLLNSNISEQMESSSFSVKRSVFMQSSTSQVTSSTLTTGAEPKVEVHSYSSESQESFKQSGDKPPVQVESHKTVEVHQVNKDKPDIHQTSFLKVSNAAEESQESSTSSYSTPVASPKPVRKSVGPRFISPLNGVIVDQGADVVLEGIIDGYPQPEVNWTKNGQPLIAKEGSVDISWKLNKARVELKNVGVKDAGRYTCTATNKAGSASSTADVVVKKTVFPPVFGRRLQAQVVKVGDRVVMEVEVTGTPEPVITWMKDGEVIKSGDQYRLKSQGNCHSLIIEKASLPYSGKYTVKAKNSGGEAQCIADFVVYQPEPTVEVVKNVIFEDIIQSETQEISSTVVMKEVPAAPRQPCKDDRDSSLEPFPFEQEVSRTVSRRVTKVPPPPSPSKFVKGEFRESDYESDYEGRIPAKWRPADSDAEEPTYRPVRPILTPRASSRTSAGGRTPTPPTEFDNPPQIGGPPRPKFEPIDKVTQPIKSDKISKSSEKVQVIFKPKPVTPKTVASMEVITATPAVRTTEHVVLEPGSPPEIGYIPPPKTGPKMSKSIFQNATQTETSKVMNFAEETETSRRVMSVQQTTRVIKFGENDRKKSEPKLEPFPFRPDPERPRRSSAPPPPKPKKFVPGEFRESDYESDYEGRIKPKWTPANSDTDEPKYRRVRPPQVTRSVSVPSKSSTQVPTPMEFDTQQPYVPSPSESPCSTLERQSKTSVQKFQYETEQRRLRRVEEMKKRFSVTPPSTTTVKRTTSLQDLGVKPGEPPEYGFVSPSTAANIASKHMSEMTSTFKSRTQQFVDDIITDMNTRQVPKPDKSILKSATPAVTNGDKEPQAYREESRVAQYASPGGSWLGKSPRGRGSTPTPPSTPGSTPTPTQQHQLRRPPVFITPLRDIAVVSGQTARFECIVQAEPAPNILWSKNGRIIESSEDYQLHYRNGVCRLTIPQAFPEDAGSYSCTATNMLGSSCTTATLQVPGTPSHIYGTYRQLHTGTSKPLEWGTVILSERGSPRLPDHEISSSDAEDSSHWLSTSQSLPEDSGLSVSAEASTTAELEETTSSHDQPDEALSPGSLTVACVLQGMVMQSSPQLTFGNRPGDVSPPVFEQIFRNARFAQGGNALFEGKVRGNPKPVVSWTRKGAPLLESNKYKMKYDEQTGNVSLLINAIGPGDEGEYTCTARNQYGEAICSVYIQPEGQGQIIQQPPGGYQREFTQTVETSEQRTTQQRFQKQTTGKISYANGHIVEEDFKVDTFEYRLLREVEFRESITRRFVGEVDREISTVVDRSLGPVAPPQIAQKPRNSKLQEGTTATFQAKVPANPRPRITWFKNGQRITQSQKYESIYSNQQAVLKINSLQSEDSGHYTLLAENPQGCVVSSAYLAVESSATQDGLDQRGKVPYAEPSEGTETGKALAPNFVRVCNDRDVTEGKMTRFDCRVTGRPYPEVAWFINGQQVRDDATHKVLVNESGNHALMITNVSITDAGVITCVARNKAGETSFQCNLNVIEKEQVVAPKFVERFSTVHVKEGEPVVLKARAVGTPIPRISWQKDGVPLAPGPEVNIHIDGGASTLDIPRAKASDAAWYQCTAQNVAGSTATRARLFVETPKGATPPPRRLNLPRPTKVIEPEPEPGPEVIYLRHVERAKPHMPLPEEERIYPPPQFIIPLNNAHQVEGGRVHFEARIEPVGDPSMKVEWFVNGRPLAASSRATATFQFGFIALDLISIQLEDSGEYVCRVSSNSGSVESHGLLSVTGRVGIEQSSQHPDSLQYIQHLEDYSRYQRTESIEEVSSQRPNFIRPLQELGELQEGRNAHFEGQLTPVSDPTMRVEWFKDGKPITASSRITTIFNFGYVSLNILHLRAEDAGTYTVRAVNRTGEAISSSTLKVQARTSVTTDLGIPEQQRYIEKVEELEAYQQYLQSQRYVQEPPESTAPPEFKSPIKDQLNIREGGFAHFEARLEPIGDSTLRVEWLKDGKPVEASSRITSFFNFGYVALTIKSVTTHDIGTYSCRAINTLGEAVTSAKLTVVSKKDIIMDSQHPGGLEKIQYLEDTSRYGRSLQEETTVTKKPMFLGPLKGTNKIVEGQRAHFEARVEPQHDTTLQIEWYFNGKVIMTANRIQTYHDFGYVALDILGVRAEDAGTYTVVARNALGEAQLSASMVVETRSSIDTTSMHRGTYEKTQRLEDSKFVEPSYHIEEISKSKPIFVQPLSDPKPISEGKNIHLECRLEPMGDPTMRVEWFYNGRPITVGSRFRTYYDFGYVALDIVQATSMDSGEYTVRATNHLGSAHTSACVRVISRSDIVTETQNESALEQIQYLEDASRHRRTVTEDVTVVQAPQFTRPLHNIETVEGTNIHLECRLQPVGDPTMRVEWLVNGQPVKTGHRFRPAYDFDYVALDLLSVYPVDSGVYTCVARNQLGEAVTSCSVKIIAKKDLILETQHPSGLEKIQYLEDTSRYRKTEYMDEVVNVRPRFITKPKNLDNMREGQHAHFECKLEPVTDPNLKVEWYKNGRPVTVGHRFRPIHDFGYVALDIIDLIAEDSGTYTCRAVNLLGSDETTCVLNCRSTAQILTGTQNETGLEQIQYLEDKSRYQRSEFIEETTKQAPIFTTSLKHMEIKEGQRAHFECRLIPVSDPTMKVEWFHNNVPVKSGSRFTETNNFGFVALDIMYCYPEDSGTYTCRAKNIVGEAMTSANLTCISKKSIYMETQHEEALSKLTYLEDTSRHQRQTVQEETVTQAPMFTQPMKDVRVAENQAMHFEARLIPVGDPKLRVEWLRNGVPIQASNRVTTMHDFGYVALNMKYVYPEDSGTYTCRAINELGQAVTSATLVVHSKASLLLESQHEAALQKLQQLEDTSRYQRREEEEIIVTQPPKFTAQLNGPTELIEGHSAHYECRIEPYPDPNMRVEWFHNGKPLQLGHRFRTTYDFGFAALDILTVYPEDSGEYTCKATNKLGQASSSIKVNVKSRSSIIMETQHEGALQKIQYLEDDSRYKRTAVEEQVIAEKPQFGRPLRNIDRLPEGQSAHLEATLTPVNDPTMRVEWFCNGRPIPQGHRFKTTYDFGYVALDILYAYAEDSGTYMCKARNAVGEAVTTCSVTVEAKSGLQLDTLDENRLRKIKDLETYERPQKPEVEPEMQKPVFITPLVSLENLKEGEHAHLECRVEPINDPNLKIEWFVNGIAIKTGHRFRTTHDFGYVALDILYTYAEDSGTYMCKATNLVGEAVNTCQITVGARRSIYLDSQHPEGLQKIQELESQGRPARLEVEEPEVTPPRFVTELRGTTEIFEGQTAHFEAQVEPLHDPNLRIEFYHNGKPLPSASRFHITFDFGYLALDITHAVPEDAGEYTAKAINALGQCTSTITLRVTAKSNIVLESQRPEGLDKIRALEQHVPHQKPEVPEPTRQRPVFTQPLQNIDSIAEGQTAHFECRLIPVGDPTLKVEWFRNEKPLETSSRITKTHDFGYVALDMTHVRAEDDGVYMCRASNALGEAVTTASMKIKTKADIQLETQHPQGMKRIQQLEEGKAPVRPEQPEQEFDKPIFTQVLTGPSELWEGQHAHFECRVVPVGDPNMRYEWYINGTELKLGSRFHVTHDFGYVNLDINSVISEDSGVYMCKAINKAGEAVSSISLKVKTRSSIIGDTLQPDAWQKIQLKEAEMNKVPPQFVDTSPQQAPVFTTHLTSHDKLVEGQNILLEAQVEPRADPNLRVEWFKNGKPLATGTRLRTTFDFGHVTLSVTGLRADDSAIYTCKATNLLGEAVSTCTLKVEDRHWLLAGSLRPEALPKIEALEEPKAGRPEAPEPTYESPVFITHLNNVVCTEGDSVHFECHVEPSKDPTLNIEWFINGKPLPTGARYKSTYDFGYVALDIIHAYAEDSGVYSCKATNSKGQAATSGTLKCTSKQDIYLQTQHPQGEAGLEAVREAEGAYLSKYQQQPLAPEKDYPKPIFVVPLPEQVSLNENEALHVECQVEPKEDPNLKVEWFFNGKPLEHATRFKTTCDFGFVTLDLTDVYERDQGIYTCKATNLKGEAFTSTTIYCKGKESLIERTQHPKGAEGLEKIQDLEESLRRQEGAPPESEEGHPPVFTSQFQNLKNLSEGEIAHFEASLTPVGDQTMTVEWFYKGEVLKASHRIRTVHAFGMVVLEILGTKIEDSGTYTCRATNKWGRAEISVELECVDKSKGQKPHFTTHIQSLENLKEGESAHFECTLTPVGDPNLKVEWFHNGQPLRHSSRIKSVSDFGFVVMDISYVQSHDTGEYVCRASNKYGEDFTRATIKCSGRGGVYLDSLQPDALARIREMELSQGGQPQTPTTPVLEPPVFTTHISDITNLVEGQSAHFEARLTPVNDPNLTVEWFYNGKKLPHGHRYRTFHDFGIVILDILYCYEENSGVYECRAVNKVGQDVTKATLKCVSKANLILDSQLPRGMEGGLEKIQSLEDSHLKMRDEKTTETKGQAPVFTVPLSNVDNLREGESAHFEARLIPTDDPKLKVEWFWNGKPLRTGSRFRTFCDFGFVILEISPVYPEDSGEYSCRAFNDYGEAVTTANMKVQGKRSIILESQLPKSMEHTIEKIAELEGLGSVPAPVAPEEDAGKPPEFVTTPSDLTLTENSLAHFECRLIPINDPSMRVEWFHNGKPLWAGSRIKTINDFGFVILEVAGVYQRDSGLYTCKATNKHGEATVSCQLQVRSRQGIILEPQLPTNFKTGTESIQKLEESLYKKDEIVSEEEKPNPPRFTVELKDIHDVQEGAPIHFECRVEPVGDPTMRIDWFHNGRPFATGSRVHMLNDFGFIVLDMDYTYARDSGEYVCVATNKWGSATTKASLTCKAKRDIVLDSQLPQGISGEKLKELERGPVTEALPEETPASPPKFITQITSVGIGEGEPVHFECRVEPRTDPKLRVEWYRNGKPLPSGHRFRTVYDMGFVSLDILYTYPEDSGEYVCRAVNDLGEDTTKATVSCKKLPTIILQNQVPKGMKKSEALMQMEATIKKYTSEIHLTEDDLYDPDKKQPPRFVTQIQDQTTLVEMQTTKFECQLAPVGDPNMKVEWFLNGKPLPHKNRFTPIYDFGYVAMNFGWVYPEDSGEYLCRATNLYGMDETRAVIRTAGKPGIIYESQLPKGMKSIERIREMEAAWQIAPEEAEEETKPRSAPVFVTKPEPYTTTEGEPARFCCRVTGHPRPRLMWVVNGQTVVNGTRYRLTYDGMWHLDIPKTRQYDHGKIEIIARNSAGEAIATTDLIVKPRMDDYRGVLKNSPRPWYDYDLTQYQRERIELERAQLQHVDISEHQKKVSTETETEWQQTVKKKKGEDYYSKLKELEEEQVIKETRLREASHQFAIPGEKVVAKTVAKGMAQSYEQKLDEKEEEKPAWVTSRRPTKHVSETVVDSKTIPSLPPEPSESAIHAREVHVAKQKQTQKEVKGDVEITRKITATETTEVEHKAKTQERVVQGPVKPAKPPFFTKKIQPVRVFEQEQARFEVEFDGDPLPTIKWFREDFPIQSSADLQIHTFSTKSVLILRQVFMEDSGVFRVVAENRGGVAKCSANLVVEEKRRQGRGGVVPPSFLTTIESNVVNSGTLVRFDARIAGTKPIDVYWLKNGKRIPSSDIRYKTLEEDNVNTLLIIEAVPEDSGTYECVAINSAGEARCEAECQVRSPAQQKQQQQQQQQQPAGNVAPAIIEPLKGQVVKEGQPVTFQCRISGKPAPQIKWQKGDNVIKPSKYFQMHKDNDIYTLRISEAFPEDEGTYKCIATNPVGSVTLSAQLKVLAPDSQEVMPTITPLKDVTVPEGSSAQFRTKVTGKPMPTIQWFREGVLIPQSADFQMIQDGDNRVLLITTTYEEDSGTFTCRATNSAGQVESSAKLIVKSKN